MAKVYLTLKERQEAELRRYYKKQFALLKMELKQAQKKKDITYEEISKKQGIAKGTVQKVLCPTSDLQTISLENLIAVCGALGIRLILNVEYEE